MFSFRLFFCCYQTCCPWTGIDTIVPSSMGTIVILDYPTNKQHVIVLKLHWHMLEN